ncbi:efflux RND transporter permease subunit [Escherichia coli]|nr:efflux RND transporter permease subunit [Escherichia coli]
MANYFIDRPVFAWVLAIIMMLAGGLAIMNLPVAQYPHDKYLMLKKPLDRITNTQSTLNRTFIFDKHIIFSTIS